MLLARPDQLVETVVEKLLMYATGRGLEYYDRPAVRAIAREAAADGHRLSALVLGVARSTPFRMRRAAGQAAQQGAHSAPRREWRGAAGSPQADAGGSGRSPV